MCTPPFIRVVPLLAGATLAAACSSGLTLPEDRSPAALHAESGDGQEGTVGSRLDDPLVVRVTDASARPLAGVPIVFQFKTEVPEAEVDPSQAETDSEGRAFAEVQLGVTAGSHTVEALVAQPSASELRTTFDLTALEAEKGKNGKGGKGGKGGGGGGRDDHDDDVDDDDDDDDDDD